MWRRRAIAACTVVAAPSPHTSLLAAEATASVDVSTDEQIQSTIAAEFGRRGRTIIAIAHRLHSIIGNDRVRRSCRDSR